MRRKNVRGRIDRLEKDAPKGAGAAAYGWLLLAKGSPLHPDDDGEPTPDLAQRVKGAVAAVKDDPVWSCLLVENIDRTRGPEDDD